MTKNILLIQADVEGAAAVIDALRDWEAGAFCVEVIRRFADAIARLDATYVPAHAA